MTVKMHQQQKGKQNDFFTNSFQTTISFEFFQQMYCMMMKFSTSNNT